ncbi:hypothetical protein [Pseudomonas lactucae]|uniref:hypothetical protein n=1 Tax=Pseudomonas lactucae TaxID=2813360 RepID=UPI00112F4AC7
MPGTTITGVTPLTSNTALIEGKLEGSTGQYVMTIIACVSGTGEEVGRGVAQAGRNFSIATKKLPPHEYDFVTRHLEPDNSVGDNTGWSLPWRYVVRP